MRVRRAWIVRAALWALWGGWVACAVAPFVAHRFAMARCEQGLGDWPLSQCSVAHWMPWQEPVKLAIAVILVVGFAMCGVRGPRRAHAEKVLALLGRAVPGEASDVGAMYRDAAGGGWRLAGGRDPMTTAAGAFAVRVITAALWTLPLGVGGMLTANVHSDFFGESVWVSPPWGTLPWVLGALTVTLAHVPTEREVFGWLAGLAAGAAGR